MIKFTNPVKNLLIEDYPIGGSHRGKCKFEVEHHPKKGSRAIRTTTNKHGIWCNPKLDTYHQDVAIVTGDDGKTYILTLNQGDYIQIERHDFKYEQDGAVFLGTDPERFAELLTLIKSAT